MESIVPWYVNNLPIWGFDSFILNGLSMMHSFILLGDSHLIFLAFLDIPEKLVAMPIPLHP